MASQVAHIVYAKKYFEAIENGLLPDEAKDKLPQNFNRDEFFLAGLLQDIGMLVLNEAFPDAYGRLAPRAGRKHEKLVALEREAFGTDHGCVGGWLLDTWNLPRNFAAAAAASHAENSSHAPDTEYLCKTVLLAGYIAEIWTNPDTAGATSFARQKAIDMLGMTPARFELPQPGF